jgi:antitoxin ParD1/3/4
MPTRNVVLTEDAVRLEALRPAVNVGVADVEAGRFKTFDSAKSPRSRVKSISGRAIPKA